MKGTLREDQDTFSILYRSILLRMKNISDKSCREVRNTDFMFNIFFFRKSCHLRDNEEKYRVIEKDGRNLKPL